MIHLAPAVPADSDGFFFWRKVNSDATWRTSPYVAARISRVISALRLLRSVVMAGDPTRARLSVLFIVCSLVFPPYSYADAKDNTWAALVHITRKRDYTVALHDRTCYMGQIVGLDDQTITLKRMKGAIVTIQRGDVLRVGEELEIGRTVYSGRSSWVDVEQIPLDSKLHTRIIMKDGRKHEGKLIKETESGLTLLEHGERVEIAKNETARVYFDRLRPWSNSDEFRIREEFIFSFFEPKAWSYQLNAGPKIPLLLYDASTVEDMGPFQCKTIPT